MSGSLTNNNNSGIKVLCRFRPLNTAEATSSSSRLCISQLAAESVQIVTSDRSLHNYTFDNCWGTNSTQKQVYEGAAKPIVDSVLQGYNGAIIAYGQTGSGKTHTMMGPNGNADVDEEEQGLCPRSVCDIFKYMEQADEGMEFSVVVSFVEIYQEKVRDLLDVSKDDLKLGEHGVHGTSVYVKDVTAFAVLSEEEVFDIMRQGAANRAVAATGMNAGSSRSHSIFSITVTQEDTTTHNKLSGKLMLVDLAGSEQVSKTGVSGQQLEELKRINRSLSALGQVINSLTDGKSTHVPYRDSKLTRLLQDCLGGNSKTSLVILCSPSSYNEMETLSTLRFGKRAKSIKNQPLVNLERGPAEWKRYAETLEHKLTSHQERISAWVTFAKNNVVGGNSFSPDVLKMLTSLITLSEKTLFTSSSTTSVLSGTESSSTSGIADALLTPQRKLNMLAGPTIASTPNVEMVDGLWTAPPTTTTTTTTTTTINTTSSAGDEISNSAREELERQNKNLVELLKEAGAELKGAKAAVDQRDGRIRDLSERLKKAETSASLAAAHAAAAAAASPAIFAIPPQPPSSDTKQDTNDVLVIALQEQYNRALTENEELRNDVLELRGKIAQVSIPIVDDPSHSSLTERIRSQYQSEISELKSEVARRTDVIASYEARVAALTRAATAAAAAAAAAGISQRPEVSAEALADAAAGLRLVTNGGEIGSSANATLRIRGGKGVSRPSTGATAMPLTTSSSSSSSSLSSDVLGSSGSGESSGFFRTLLKRLSVSPNKAAAQVAAERQAENNEALKAQEISNNNTIEDSEQAAITHAAFFKACEEGDIAHVKDALTTGKVRPSSMDKSGRTGLLYAGRGGQLKIVQSLVRAGCPVTSYDKDARNALAYAARRGHVEVASWLISQGVSPNAADIHGLTPLHQAVLGRHTAVCELLLGASADLKVRDSNGNTAYKLAKRFGADDRDDSRAVLLCLRARLKSMTNDEQLAAGRDASSLPPVESRSSGKNIIGEANV
jgi:hypothetical protein